MADLRRLFDYDAWANRDALASLRAAAPTPVRGLKVMGHIIAAELLWHARLTGTKAELPVWPELAPAECATWLDMLEGLWARFLDRSVPARLAVRISYVNSQGEAFTSTVDDVLTHVVMHSAYHRGQIAADVRAGGHEPAYTDFIHAVRTGRVA